MLVHDQLAFHNVAELITLPEAGRPISHVSANIQTILGYLPAYLTKPDFRFTDLIHPQDLPRHNSDIRDRLAAHAHHFEASYRLRHASGEYRWFHELSRPDYDHGQTCYRIRSYLFDQTKLKQAQDALLQREKQIAAISAHIPGMLYVLACDPKGDVSMPYVSQGIHELLSLTPEQLRHDASPFFARVDPRDHQALVCSIQASFSARTDWSFEFRVQHPERGVRWLYGSASPRLLDDGQYVWDGCCFDITERKTAEENLIRENKRKAIERLAGGIAHDFNNYLNSIALSAELIRSLPEATPRIQKLAAILVTEISSATAVAQQLLSFTKDQPVHKDYLDLAPFLRECAAFALRGSSVSAVINVAEPDLRLYTDPHLLRQVIFNLILNARQATNDKGRLTLTAETSSPLVILRVSDDGPGISPSHAKKIFDPYYTTKAKGSGLGLHVVRSILHRLGGEIYYDPHHHPGASFVITLPVSHEAELAA